jgi:dTDP-4-dehydrorhamnose reductase
MIKYGREREGLNVVYDQVGTPTYAKDLAKVILDIIPSAFLKSGVDLFHYSNCDIKPILTKEYPLPAQRPCFSVLNKSRIKEMYNIRIPYWSDSVKDCIQRLG